MNYNKITALKEELLTQVDNKEKGPGEESNRTPQREHLLLRS